MPLPSLYVGCEQGVAAPMVKMKFLVATSLALLLAGTAFSRLEILSFNVKNFGMSKISDQDTVNILIKVSLTRFITICRESVCK